MFPSAVWLSHLAASVFDQVALSSVKAHWLPLAFVAGGLGYVALAHALHAQ